MAKQRAAYFSAAELQLLMEGYEEVRHLINTKGNTIAAAKVRQDAWRKITFKLNASNPMGPRRTWQQVKTKYKNIVQSANKRKAALKRMGLVPTKEEYIDEEEPSPENNVDGPIIESIVGGCSSDPGDVPGCSNYVRVTEHGLALLQPPLSDEELDSEPVEDVKTLYKKYLQTEISNRKQEMAYRALKMQKVEKEIQLLDRKLDISTNKERVARHRQKVNADPVARAALLARRRESYQRRKRAALGANPDHPAIGNLSDAAAEKRRKQWRENQRKHRAEAKGFQPEPLTMRNSILASGDWKTFME